MENWVTKPAVYDQSFEDYKKRMYEAGKDRPKRPASTLQCASMQAIIDRDPSKDAEHWNRPIPVNAQIKDSTGEVYVAERQTTIEEVKVVEEYRRKSKNTFGDAVSSNQGSSVTESKRVSASSAFTCTPPAILNPEDHLKIVGIEPIKSEVPIGDLEIQKQGWFEKKFKKGRLVRKGWFWAWEEIE